MPIPWTIIRRAFVCALLVATCAGSAQADPTSPRVRPLGARIASLLARGRVASPTLAVLVDALERSDLIVHIEEWWWPQKGTIGETRFITRAGGQRYLRISLDGRVRDEAGVALLGHELHHAWEIAQAPWVIDQETLFGLYGQIGHRSHVRAGTAGVDTKAARDAAQHVRAELRAYGAGRLSPAD